MSEFVTEIEKNQFDQQVFQRQKTQPVIVDFWAPWCGPCRAMAPAFTALAETYQDKMVFVKCNVDDHPAVAERYGIKSIPTLMIFQGGDAVNSITGMVSRGVLEDEIKKALSGEVMPTPFIVN